jgi:hypothetical protein
MAGDWLEVSLGKRKHLRQELFFFGFFVFVFFFFFFFFRVSLGPRLKIASTSMLCLNRAYIKKRRYIHWHGTL